MFDRIRLDRCKVRRLPSGNFSRFSAKETRLHHAFVYKGDPERGEEWRLLFAQKAPEIDFRVWPYRQYNRCPISGGMGAAERHRGNLPQSGDPVLGWSGRRSIQVR